MGERILIIDDDNELCQLVQRQLTDDGYEIAACHDGSAGLVVASEMNPDLVLLETLLPGLDGWEVCQQLQLITRAPIVFMSALGEDRDLLRGLELGADDYIIKPFECKELRARVRAALHRARRTSGSRRQYRCGRLSVDLDTRTVKADGERVSLTPIEYGLLAVLVEQSGHVVSHSELLQRVWGPQFRDRRHYLKLYIWYLRQKVEQDPGKPQIILTERGQGYRLAAAPSAADG